MDYSARILIADDEAGFLKTTVRLLSDEGYLCDAAASADEARTLLATNEYNLVVADIVMPGNPQLQMIEHIAKECRGLPVIIVTGYPSVGTAIKALELPVFAYVLKPLDFDVFAKKVGDAVRWNHVYRTIAEAEKRLADSIAKAAQISELMAASKEDISQNNLRSFLTMTYTNVVSAVMDLGNLVEVLLNGKDQGSVCHILNCPQVKVFEEALQQAIDVLHATKGNFKSKEIADLRRNLEELLESQRKKLHNRPM
jgi:DNA-binding response OmpR family regulator